MTLFWGLAAALTAVSLLFLFVPLFGARPRAGSSVPTEGLDARVSVYRAQLAELEADRDTGTISEEQFNTARLDLQRSLLEMSERTGAEPVPLRGSWRWPAGLASILAVPLLAVLIYQGHGAGPAGLDPQVRAPQGGGQPLMEGGIEAAVMALSSRLEENPQDPGGWALLGRSLTFLEQPRAAAAAYAQAIRYGGGNDPDILLSYADLLGILDNGNLNARARPYIDQALAMDPDHVNALWLAGLAAFRGGDFSGAQDHWKRLASQFPPGSEEAVIIRQNLDEVEMRLSEETPDAPTPAEQ